jgi:DNA-binding transcriptional ArsR family regulator
METHGFLAPETGAAARDHYEAVGPAAQTVVKETAKAMAFDADEYDERVTGEVVETARDALFASLLEVHAGTREEYEDWLADRDREVVEEGSENVSRVAWHDALGETVVAATYESEERAAVVTLRRQAFGRVYRDIL